MGIVMSGHEIPLAIWDHTSWYTFTSHLDLLRSELWLLTNLVTFVSYFAIPLELWYWRRALRILPALGVAMMFIVFIAACGLSHLAMVIIMGTAPWWTMMIFIPMAIASVGTAIVIRQNRKRFIDYIQTLELIKQADNDTAC